MTIIILTSSSTFKIFLRSSQGKFSKPLKLCIPNYGWTIAFYLLLRFKFLIFLIVSLFHMELILYLFLGPCQSHSFSSLSIWANACLIYLQTQAQNSYQAFTSMLFISSISSAQNQCKNQPLWCSLCHCSILLDLQVFTYYSHYSSIPCQYFELVLLMPFSSPQ